MSINKPVCPIADTIENLSNSNVIFKDGQRIYDTTNKKWKTGDGNKTWSQLDYDTTPSGSGEANVDLSGYQKIESLVKSTSIYYLKNRDEFEQQYSDNNYVAMSTLYETINDARVEIDKAADKTIYMTEESGFIVTNESNENENSGNAIIIGFDGCASGVDGIAIGHYNQAEAGITIGSGSSSFGDGIAIGNGAISETGIGIGNGIVTNGIAIGHGANTTTMVDDEETAIDAIQLGAGNNSEEHTFQVYDYQLLNAEGKIPTERLPEGIGSDSSADLSGYEKTENKLLTTDWEIADIDPNNPQSPEEDEFFNSEKYVGVKVAAKWAKDAYDVGFEAKDIAEGLSNKLTNNIEPAIDNLSDLTNKGLEYIEIKDTNAEWYPASINIGMGGGNSDNYTCIGFNTEGNGICIGNNAKSLYSAETALEYDAEAGTPLNAIQIGAGTNNHPNTFQVGNYQLLDAEGKIPAERLPEGISGGGSEILQEELERLIYYGDKDIFPTESEYIIGSDGSFFVEEEIDVDTFVVPYKLSDGSLVRRFLNLNIRANKIIIPNTVTSFGEYSFRGIKEVIIPKSVKEIEWNTFMDSIITQIIIPKNVEKIYNSAFGNTTELKYVYFENDNVEFVYSDDSTDVDSIFYVYEWYSDDEPPRLIANPNLTFICNPDSTAEAYAKKYGIKYEYNHVKSEDLGGSSVDLSGYEKTENKITNVDFMDAIGIDAVGIDDEHYPSAKQAHNWAHTSYSLANQAYMRIDTEVFPVLYSTITETNKKGIQSPSSTTVENMSIGLGKNAEATGTYSVAIGSNSSAKANAIAIGANASTIDIFGQGGIAIGENSITASGIAIGRGAETLTLSDSEMPDYPVNAIQLGEGRNPNEGTFQVGIYQLLDANGNIPVDRLSNVFELDGDNLKINIGGKTYTLQPDNE